MYVVVSIYHYVNPSRKSCESFLDGEKVSDQRDALQKKEDICFGKTSGILSRWLG